MLSEWRDAWAFKAYSKDIKQDRYEKVEWIMEFCGGTNFFLACTIKKYIKKINS